MEINLDAVQTFGAASAALALGLWSSKKIRFVHQYNLPSSVIGGLIICLILLVFRQFNLVTVNFTKSFSDPLMYTFFASIGFAASVDTLKRGGKGVLSFLIICSIFTLLQNILGIGIAKAFNLHPLFGVLTGSVALTGGPGTAMAFAKSFSEVGVAGAEVAGISAALSGILIGGLTGGPLATILIKKYQLHSKLKETKSDLQTKLEVSDEGTIVFENLGTELLRQFILIGVVLWIGTYLSVAFENAQIKLPGYIGAMIAAAVIRNVGEHFKPLKVNVALMDDLGSIALALFLSMALISLEIWKISSVALPLIVTMILQTALVLVGAYYVIYRTQGKNYDSAVIASGFVGFMMGTTANAMTNMKALVDRYGPSPRAFLVVPIVGACFIDFINATLIFAFLNAFK